jgi:hypothetical protein
MHRSLVFYAYKKLSKLKDRRVVNSISSSSHKAMHLIKARREKKEEKMHINQNSLEMVEYESM